MLLEFFDISLLSKNYASFENNFEKALNLNWKKNWKLFCKIFTYLIFNGNYENLANCEMQDFANFDIAILSLKILQTLKVTFFIEFELYFLPSTRKRRSGNENVI